MFFAVRNLTELSCVQVPAPWDFKITGVISDDVRKSKADRQAWYKMPSTDHQFYTPIEGANPNMRVSQDNPPKYLHGIGADFDVKIPLERALEAVAAMKIKPSHIERSLGGNLRLIWQFHRPLCVESMEFCKYVLTESNKWLDLDLLPGLDEGALTTPTRMLCNGGEWHTTGHGTIHPDELQAFFVKCAQDYNFIADDGYSIPLELIEAKLKEKHVSFNWPGAFEVDSTGPTFWIPESTSPNSAILKPDGFVTFAAHATKPFYSWADLLGADFIRQFKIESIAKATANKFWDGKKFWRMRKDEFVSCEMTEIRNILSVNCGLRDVKVKGQVSPMEAALNHLFEENRISGAAPFVFQKPGLIEYQTKKILNIYSRLPIAPWPAPCKWGPDGDFPFLSGLLDNMFDPKIQLVYFLAWMRYAYLAALNSTPLPGQNTFVMGPAGIGKTLLNREIFGRLLGGHADASDFLIKGQQFNSSLFEVPVWSIDDDNASDSDTARTNFSAMIKKVTANASFQYKKKFEIDVMVEWLGRIFITTNLDYVSSRLLGNVDNTSLDKTNIFRCSDIKFQFPNRLEIVPTIIAELPKFARWLLDMTVADCVKLDVRYGYASYHEKSLLQQTQQTSKSAPFQELLIESLNRYFADKPTETQWSGTVTQVIKLILFDPGNELVLRSMRLEQAARYLESMQRAQVIPCEVTHGTQHQRLWVFKRPT